MRNLLVAILILALNSISEGQVIPLPDLYNFNDSFLLGSINEEIALNKQVKAFKTDKKFIYNYYLIEDDISKSKSQKKIYVVPYWSFVGNDTIMRLGIQNVNTSNSYLVDKLNLIVTNKKSNTDLLDDQIIVKYEFSNKKGVIKGISEITGVIEDSTLIFLHPPRSNGFAAIQYAPFPMVRLNDSNISWVGPIEIPAKREFNLPALTLEHTYTKLNDTTINFKGKQIICQVVNAETSKNKFNIFSESRFLYNTEMGFISMVYIVKINDCLQKFILDLENIEN